MEHHIGIFSLLLISCYLITTCQAIRPLHNSCSALTPGKLSPPNPNSSIKNKIRKSYRIAEENIALENVCQLPPIRGPENYYTVDAFYVQRRLQESEPNTEKLSSTQKLFEEVAKVLNERYNFSADHMPSQQELEKSIMAHSVKKCIKLTTHVKCKKKKYKYRYFDGSCNNLEHPTWGMATVCLDRLHPPVYNDGIYELRKAISGKKLPNERKLSVTLHNDKNTPDEKMSLMFMQFGQFIAHDMAGSPFKIKRSTPVDCCRNDPLLKNSECIPIKIDGNDPFYPKFGIHCLNAIRTGTCPTCSLGAREQTDKETSFIDGSVFYGPNKKINAGLRNMDGTGTLRSTSVKNSREILPQTDRRFTDACSFQANDSHKLCLHAGDTRGNMHRTLTVMHILFLREHNRIARWFHKNYHWSDEKIFQETRRILSAQFQMICYNEYLPPLLGPEYAKNLTVKKNLLYTQYDSTVKPTMLTEFSTAAFRYAHSTLDGALSGTPEFPYVGISLRDVYNWPFDYYNKGQLEDMTTYMVQSPAQQVNRHVTEDLTNHLYKIRGQNHGLDLVMLDIFRGRERGLPTYAQMLKFCGGPEITSFNQLNAIFSEGDVEVYASMYESVQDIDLFSGGLAEKPVDGGIVGRTFACIMEKQFYKAKYGDRFYFEHEKQAGSFTEAQLKEIKKTTLAKFICDNSDIDTIQEYVFLQPSSENPNKPCKDLPDVDLNAWSDE